MKNDIQKRVLKEANEVVSKGKTIREVAKHFNVSKSTVHKDLSERLLCLNNDISKNVHNVFEEHWNSKHLRGGSATRNKYKGKLK